MNNAFRRAAILEHVGTRELREVVSAASTVATGPLESFCLLFHPTAPNKCGIAPAEGTAPVTTIHPIRCGAFFVYEAEDTTEIFRLSVKTFKGTP